MGSVVGGDKEQCFIQRRGEFCDIHERIGLLEEEIQRLKLEHNSRTTICRLPSELLSRIFVLCVPHPTQTIINYHHPLMKELEWLAFTHVCHLWRTISLNHPAIWNCPNFTIPPLAQEMIARSKQSLLDIVFRDNVVGRDITPKSMQVLSETLCLQASRIRNLDLCLRTEDLQRLSLATAYSMPFLRSITIKPADWFEYDEHEALLLPKDFLGGGTPVLARLRLKHSGSSWESGMLQNLTILDLDGSGFYRPLAEQFYGVLRRSPQLEELRLTVDAVPHSVQAALPTVSLPCLRLLSLHSPISPSETLDCSQVFEHISFPPTAKILFQIRTWAVWNPTHPLVQAVRPCFDAVSQRLATFAPAVLRVLSLMSDHEEFGYKLYLRAWDTQDVQVDTLHTLYSHPNLSFRLDWDHYYHHQFGQIAIAALRVVPTESIDTLEIGYLHSSMTCTDVSELLAPYLQSEYLKNLCVQGSCTANVLSTLHSRGRESLAMPALRILALDFSEVNADENTILLLRSYLDLRIKHGAKLHKLILRNCRDESAYRLEEVRDLVDMLEERVGWIEPEEILTDSESDLEGD